MYERAYPYGLYKKRITNWKNRECLKNPKKISKNQLTMCISRDRIIELSLEGLVNSGMKKSFEKVLTSPSEDDRIIELSLEELVNSETKKSFKKVLTKFLRNDKLR
ncbi:hypothetical protein FAJ34_06200 [Streptococcus suis]|uniref:Uncharacterized protein n=1 Tax=Streptococcus suis TaxID=1307 RepID=A0A4T2H8R6_STRSU|nr:hypothetical protein FAJ34_06200 [Streptococcus suis]